ncbi:MAG: hypothetical protein EBU66_17240, partial [Bacteroidetes bacterium]|nr:hypothetical protein [Bacteroidota bacterium]
MPQLSRVSTVNNDVRIRKLGDANISITPVPTGYATPLINIKSTSGVLTLPGGTYNLTPNTTFTANVLIWGAGGGSSTGNGGAGGFSTAYMRF